MEHRSVVTATLCVFILIVLPALAAVAQAEYMEPLIADTVRTYGNEFNDQAYGVIALADGGTMIAGIADNRVASHRVLPGRAHVIRTDSDGNVLWERDYGGELNSVFSSVIQVAEDAFLLLGEIEASAIDVWDEDDVYMVKIDGDGDVLWEHVYGDVGGNSAKQVRRTSDGGFILVGSQVDRFMTAGGYQSNLLLIKTDADGNEIWSRTYGDGVLYLASAVEEAPDGGYVVAGWEAPNNWDDRNVLVAKTDADGELEWWQTWDLSERGRDGGFGMILTSDEHIVVACIQSMGSGAPSAVLLKLGLDGEELWHKLVGLEGIGNTFWSVMEDVGGNYLMIGDTHVGHQAGTGVTLHAGLIVKTDTSGELLWERSVGQGEYDQVQLGPAAQFADGSIVFVGNVIPIRTNLISSTYSDMLWLKVAGPLP